MVALSTDWIVCSLIVELPSQNEGLVLISEVPVTNCRNWVATIYINIRMGNAAEYERSSGFY